tara:strand:+ start:7001 stop:8812 length:1812 start_codon:yes stop_codon:yes gene_type:complete
MQNKNASSKNSNHYEIDLLTYPIPNDLIDFKDDISISTINHINTSNQQIINKAKEFYYKGQSSKAIEYHQYYLNQGINDADFYNNYSQLLRDLGRLEEAEIFARKAIKLSPDCDNNYFILGLILKKKGKLNEAEILFRKAIELNASSSEYYLYLSNILRDLGDLQKAEMFIRKSIELNSENSIAYFYLGNILRDVDKLKEAKLSLLKAIQLKPDYAKAYCHLGGVFKLLGELEQSETFNRRAIQLKPDYAEAHLNLGNSLRELGNLTQAEIFTRKAIDLKPNFADAFFNLALILLLNENYIVGFDYYEYRFKKEKPVIPHGNANIKIVNDEKLDKREKLLVITEQGLGDTLQYMRYVPYLRNQGFDISFCAQTKLHSLIKASGIDPNPLNPEQTNTILDGKWIPLLSLPKYLKITPQNPLVTDPYIFTSNELAVKWKNIFSKHKRPIIGINWQGNLNMEQNYQGRSIPLEIFAIILEQNDITMVSLQKGYGSEQLEYCSFKKKFIECQSQIDLTWDFLENAAIIKNCDLIITCDTSIAHLAGGMGKKVWLLLKSVPFWTWGKKGESTFWYKSMRLFRQKERNNWKETIVRVSNELKKELRDGF